MIVAMDSPIVISMCFVVVCGSCMTTALLIMVLRRIRMVVVVLRIRPDLRLLASTSYNI
jgi:hypothetical protein